MTQTAANASINHTDIAPEATYIEHLQRHLFAVGWCLMSNHPAEISFAQLTTEMEQRIDNISATLPTLHTFVIPGNSVPEAQCHVCRTVCRRAERAVAAVAEERNINPQVLAFINRLSDYLFVLARKLNFITHQEEKDGIKVADKKKITILQLQKRRDLKIAMLNITIANNKQK